MAPGRNDPCPCGSGRKHKHCCGQAAAAGKPAISMQEIGALVELLGQDRLDEVERGARALAQRRPDAGIAWKILGVAQVRLGTDALAALQRAVELLPADAEAHRNLGAWLHDHSEWGGALVSLRRALALTPDDVETLVDCANALKALGRTDEALPLYQRALAQEPGHAEAHNNLGNAYLQLGLYEDAARRYRSALSLRPRDLQVLANLGAVLRDLGARQEACSVYARAVGLEPGNVDFHCSLGSVLFEMHRVEDAAASYRRALELQPHWVPAHLGLALVLRQQRRAAEAETSCRAALALEPENVEAVATLGELLADRGQFDDAESMFRRALAINPDFAPAYAGIASHRRMTSKDSAWRSGAERLLRGRKPLVHEISLHYALGKYFDDLATYDSAFEHYRQANELTKRFGGNYDRARLEHRIDEIIARFGGGVVNASDADQPTSDLPVLIIGMPRSGTSLAEQILASHPSVFGAGEVAYWNGAYDRFRRAEAEGKATDALITDMRKDYLLRLGAMAGGATRVVDKMPGNFLYAGLIHAALPRARIIHMQRHPIDTCLSIYFQNFYNIGPYANDLDDLAHFYQQYQRITDHWRAVLPAASFLEVPYEALVADPEGWSRRMVDFIGLPWDPRCLEFHATDRVVITASKWQVRQKISTKSAGRWRNYEAFVAPLRSLLQSAASA
ncbi:MAG: sulfotransferase [Steroidobacteraceae bacterium]